MGKNTTKLTITLSPNGQVSVTGPIDNAMLCYGLLEVAKDVVRMHVQKKAENGIVIPRIMLPGNGGVG